MLQYVIIGAVILFYIYRFITSLKKQQELARQQAERKGQSVQDQEVHDQPNPVHRAEEPKTLEDILTEVFRDVETKTKPYARPEAPKSMRRQLQTERKKALQQTTRPSVKQHQQKKEPRPFLSEDYTPEVIEAEGTPSHLMEDYLKKTQISDAYNKPKQELVAEKKFNARDAVIASMILNRPEW